MFRSTNPRSWWWTPEIDFHARELHALEGANWQRSKSKKNPPKPITRPKEIRRNAAVPLTGSELQARKQKFKEIRKAVS